MAGLLRSGLTLHTSLTLLYEQASRKDALTLKALLEGVEGGEPLSMLLHRHKFHPMVPAMTLVGEESGNLVHAFNRLGEHFRHQYEWKQKIVNSLVYPAVVAIVTVLVTIFVLYGILPRFETMYLNLGFFLPTETQTLFEFTSKLRILLPWILIFLCFLASVLFFMRRVVRSRFPKAGAMVFAIPGIRKIWRMWISYRLADSIAVMTSSGVPLLQALDTCERTARFSLEQKVIRRIKEQIFLGDTFTKALQAQHWIDPLLVHAVHAAEASGDLAGVCGFASKELEGDLQRMLQRLVQLVEPTIIVGLGVLVGFIVFAVVMPMMQMVQSI
ncbi:type II secretion system F family protein [Effusibacillus consociatus]|uniref:Type II secretion system F family protein n=2 Tax=Effusibacillus consociatus TaxID=1117041 RepID=A0ABV9Q5C4_9BACL